MEVSSKADVGTMQPELQRLIEGKESIDVFTAARYLELNLVTSGD